MLSGIFGTGSQSDGAARGRPDLDARFDAASEVETYWQALRAEGQIPNRADLDPRGIRGALSKAFILECTPQDEILECTPQDEPRFRIVGSDITVLASRELRGLPMSALVAPQKRKIVRALVQDVTRLPATAQLDFKCAITDARSIPVRIVLLPMKDSEGQLTRILGCLDVDLSQPVNFALDDLELSGSILRPLGREHQAIVRRMQRNGLTVVDGSGDIRTRPRRPSKKPFLTLVTT